MWESPVKRTARTTSQTIIEGAISVMAESGLPRLTTKLVGAKADVSTASIHYFFETKDRLIYESFAHVIRGIRQQFFAARKNEPDPLKRIRKTLEVFFSDQQITGDTVKIWPQLWVHAGTNAETARLFRVYNGRMISNFTHDLREAGMGRDLARIFAFRLNALHRGLWIEMHVAGLITKDDSDKIHDAMMETITQNIGGKHGRH